MQFLKRLEESPFFPQVHEEIFLVNVETKTILNYVAIVEYPNLSIISMLSGPSAVPDGDDGNMVLEEEAVRSQEVFT